MKYKYFCASQELNFGFKEKLVTLSLMLEPVLVKIGRKYQLAPPKDNSPIFFEVQLHKPSAESERRLWQAYTGLKSWLQTQINEKNPLHFKVSKVKQKVKQKVKNCEFTFEVLEYEPEFLEDSHCGYETRNRFLGEVQEVIGHKITRILAPMAV